MKEININIPYSDFKMFFYKWFRRQGSLYKKEESHTLEIVKKYWLILDSELREKIIGTCESLIGHGRATQGIVDFILWVNTNRNNPQKANMAQPLNDIIKLPVVHIHKENLPKEA